LVEIVGIIVDLMRKRDNEVKKFTDEVNEIRNNLAALNKGKDGSSFYTKDLGNEIYNSDKINPDVMFVERHGCENLATLIAIVHKTKV